MSPMLWFLSVLSANNDQCQVARAFIVPTDVAKRQIASNDQSELALSEIVSWANKDCADSEKKRWRAVLSSSIHCLFLAVIKLPWHLGGPHALPGQLPARRAHCCVNDQSTSGPESVSSLQAQYISPLFQFILMYSFIFVIYLQFLPLSSDIIKKSV